MDKKLKGKFRNILRKESFYIALFLCICVVAAIGTVSYKRISNQHEVAKVEQPEKELTLNINDKSVTNEIPNAERVENTAKEDKNINNANAKSVASTTVSLVNPINGKIARGYTYPKPVKVEENLYRTIRGINISSKIGTEVKAAADGVVDVVENTGVEEGTVVEIKHANGLKTRYCNLDQNVLVKNGDKVKTSQVIAKVGDTAKLYNKEAFGEYLNLQVINSNGEQVNPEKYFKLK